MVVGPVGTASICAAALAGVLAFATPCAAATPLPWSSSYTAIRSCLDAVCASTTDVEVNHLMGYDFDANAFATAPGLGTAFGSASAGTGALALPVLKAYATSTQQGTGSAFVQGVQGYRWTGPTGIDIAFSGLVDYQGTGPGFVTAGLAITDASVRDLAVGTQWAVGFNDGAFSATCATPGGVALVNSGRQYAAGANSFGIDTSDGSCLPGAAVFHVEPGQEFYVFTRLLTFGLLGGTRDASHTFTVGLSPTLPEETRASINQYLTPFQPLAAVPEPSTWASMILGFGAIGGVIRRARKRAAESSVRLPSQV